MSAARRIALALALVVSACGGGEPGTVVVSAASSLTDAFTALEVEFEHTSGVDVVLNFAASSTLREQISEGAPVDVFAPADPASMAAIADLVGQSSVFAVNRLQIAVPAGNPAGITGLDDFARDELVLGVCVPAAPCGDLARAAFDLAGVAASIDTEEPNVRAVLTKVAAGELDAGLVYVTDVLSTGGAVEGVPIEASPVTDYPIAVVNEAGNPEAAAAFVEFVLSERGRAILAEYGFESP